MEKREERIKEVCQEALNTVNERLAEAIAHAFVEGYKVGWFEGRESSEAYVKAVNEFKQICNERKE